MELHKLWIGSAETCHKRSKTTQVISFTPEQQISMLNVSPSHRLSNRQNDIEPTVDLPRFLFLLNVYQSRAHWIFIYSCGSQIHLNHFVNHLLVIILLQDEVDK